MTYVLRTYDITKVVGGKNLVTDVSMHVKQGHIYGFLGPNGAGKTTMMRILTNLVKPTWGDVELFGKNVNPQSYDVLKRIGSIIEYPIFYEHLTAYENLELHCEYMGYHDKQGIKHALELVRLPSDDRKKVKQFSLGMKQRLGIARAIVTKPELLILDEPINGLDPAGIKEMRDLFRMLSREFGMTLLISSHILAEVEQIADTIGVISGGRLLEEVDMDNIRGSNTEYIELKVNHSKKAAYVLEEHLRLRNFKVMDNNIIRIYDADVQQQSMLRLLVQYDIVMESIGKKNNSLEDYFLNLMEGVDKHASHHAS